MYGPFGFFSPLSTHLETHAWLLQPPPKEPVRWCCSYASLLTEAAPSSFLLSRCHCFLQVSIQVCATLWWDEHFIYLSQTSHLHPLLTNSKWAPFQITLLPLPSPSSSTPVTQLSVTAATMWRPAPTYWKTVFNESPPHKKISKTILKQIATEEEKNIKDLPHRLPPPLQHSLQQKGTTVKHQNLKDHLRCWIWPSLLVVW